MKAVLFREHGGPETLSYEDLPEPTIGPEDVLIRVKACALNHLDIWIRQGNPAYPIPLPHVSGSMRPELWSKLVVRLIASPWDSGCLCPLESAAGNVSSVWRGVTICAARMGWSVPRCTAPMRSI